METVVIAALIMGLAGSLHCVGMCGPLISVMPYDRSSQWKFTKTKSLNHLGRITTYVVLGLLFGLAGQGIAGAGFQQWLSIVSGMLILAILFWPAKWRTLSPKGHLIRLVSKLKQAFSHLLEKRNPGTLFFLGALNGLLPCGLVYFALAASIATGDMLKGGIFMFFFGLGTTPALVAVGAMAAGLRQKFAYQFRNSLKIMLIVTALLLIARGSNLGIPYLSPKVNIEKQEVDCCHRP